MMENVFPYIYIYIIYKIYTIICWSFALYVFDTENGYGKVWSVYGFFYEGEGETMATQNYYVTYSRTPKRAVKKDTQKESIRKWRSQWEETAKGAITKFFFSKCRK